MAAKKRSRKVKRRRRSSGAALSRIDTRRKKAGTATPWRLVVSAYDDPDSKGENVLRVAQEALGSPSNTRWSKAREERIMQWRYATEGELRNAAKKVFLLRFPFVTMYRYKPKKISPFSSAFM